LILADETFQTADCVGHLGNVACLTKIGQIPATGCCGRSGRTMFPGAVSMGPVPVIGCTRRGTQGFAPATYPVGNPSEWEADAANSLLRCRNSGGSATILHFSIERLGCSKSCALNESFLRSADTAAVPCFFRSRWPEL